MGDLLAQLTPELIGLVVTPAAVVACLVLLGSTHPLRNVAILTAVFVGVYGVLAVLALAAGRAADDVDGPRGVVSIVLGVLFLALAAFSARPSHPTRSGPPAWVRRLEDPAPALVAGVAAVLALVNPNVAILVSGLGVVLAADVTPDQQVVGALLLLAACLVDFVVPTVAYLASGPRGRDRLRGLTRWLIRHNRALGIGVLVVFGVLFVFRGLAALG